MRVPSFLLPALLAVLPAWAGPLPPTTLEQACARADVVVLGTLGDRISKATGESGSWISGEIRVKEVLYGRPGDVLPVRWERHLPGGDPPPADWEDLYQDKVGHERIWCLHRNGDGNWGVFHPVEIQPVEARKEVEKAIQARLAPSLRIVEAQTQLEPWNEGMIRDLRGLETRQAEVQQAKANLIASGPAAFPGVRALLSDASPIRRAWGCAVAGGMKDKALTDDLASLLDDEGIFIMYRSDKDTCEQVANKALKALGEIAGKPFASKEEARAWAKTLSQQPKEGK